MARTGHTGDNGTHGGSGRKAHRLSNQIMANAGVFLACHQLSKLGWQVLPTSRNAKAVDIVAYHEDDPRPVTLQVKAMSAPRNICLGPTPKCCADYFIVCVLQSKESLPKCYVFRLDDVARHDDSIRLYAGKHWLQRKAFATQEYAERWDRILPVHRTGVGQAQVRSTLAVNPTFRSVARSKEVTNRAGNGRQPGPAAMKETDS
jgi:hypothetical protein